MQGKRERNWRRGEALWQGGMAPIRPSQLTKKSWRIFGGKQSSIALLSLPAGFLFSPYSNIHIFEYIWMPNHRLNDNITWRMLPKWNATTSHNFNSSLEQSSFIITHWQHHQQQQQCPESVQQWALQMANSMLTYLGSFTGLMEVLLNSRIVQPLFFLGNLMDHSLYLNCLQGWLMEKNYWEMHWAPLPTSMQQPKWPTL